MGLTASLYTGLSGLSASSTLISIAGNNIANANTNGYKASRLNFETQISQVLSNGSAPSASSGGTNPLSVGLGVKVGSTSRDFTTGNITPTGVSTDMAIDGNGFFVLDYGAYRRYTRAGDFSLDKSFNLTYNGGKVMGYGVDSDFNVTQSLTDVVIPLGNMTLAEPTTNIVLGGNLNSGGAVATQGSALSSAALTLLGGGAATGASLLTNLDDGTGAALFATGDLITIKGATKGGAVLPDHTFRVGPATGAEDYAGTTLDDFNTFLSGVLGLDPSVGGAGVTINGSGQIVITGNSGTVNDLVLDTASIINNAGSANPTQPFTMTKSQSADGESVRTTFIAYDSLGNTMNVDLYAVLESKADSGTNWRFYVQSEDDSRITRSLGDGTLSFDNQGQLSASTNTTFSINRSGTGAATPQSITLDLANSTSTLSALTDTVSQISSLSQDGAPMGTLQSFSVSGDGTIVGQFSNSKLRTIGQIVLANFTNPQGLVEQGGNLYSESVNSGSAQVLNPTTGGVGKIDGGAVELSNVDLSQEFINLISASTGFSASSRVLTTGDQLIQELLATIR